MENGNETAAPPFSPKEPTAAAFKTADRPHVWTVALSIAAIVISLFSYFESHRSRLLNEELNRPLVRAMSVEYDGPVLAGNQIKGTKQQNGYTIMFQNTGRAFANNVRCEFKSQINDSRTGPQFARFSAFQDATIISESIGDLAPDDVYKRAFWSLVLKEPPTVNFGENKVSLVSVYVKGQTVYQNPINGAEYKTPFCFVDSGTMGHFNHCTPNDPQ